MASLFDCRAKGHEILLKKSVVWEGMYKACSYEVIIWRCRTCTMWGYMERENE